MTQLLARMDDWSDRISPIVVKEVRQMVRGREFNYSFGASLFAGLVVAFFGLADALTSAGTSGGKVFSALMFCLGLLGVVVVPLGAFSTLRNERSNQTLDLITQTTLSPRGIVVGKLLTQWVKLLTLFAGIAPFITISFLLGGIDLTTILISLAVLFMWSMWVCAASLFLSSATQSRAMSAAVFIVLTIVVIWALITASGAAMFLFTGGAGMGPLTFSEISWFLAGMTAVCLVSMTNLVLLAENRLSLAIEDRSTALRVGFFVQFLLILTCVAAPYFAKATGFSAADAMEGLIVLGGLHLAITAAFAITEDMTLSKRVFRRVQKSLNKPWLAIFRPGGGRGAAWILTQMAILIVLGWTIFTGLEFRMLLATCAYVCFFTGVPTVILRRVTYDKLRSAVLRAGILIFFPVIAISADIFQYFLAPGRVFDGSFSAYHMLNPFRALSNWNQVEEQGWQGWTLVMGLAGVLAYIELFRKGWQEDQNAANRS